MRTEEEMLRLLTDTALADPRIRAAYLEGSRTCPSAVHDRFSDYDVEYVVTSTAPFRADGHWIDRFGRRLYWQCPEESVYFPADPENCYGWLMQFEDGVRLDLHVCTLSYALASLETYRVLADKDGCLPAAQNFCEDRFRVRPQT